MLVLLCAGAGPAQAHQASDAFLDLRRDGDGVAVRWDVALRDLDLVIDLDGNDDGVLQWGEIRQRESAIEAHAEQAIELTTPAGVCRRTDVTHAVAQRNDGAYAVLRWRAECPAFTDAIGIRYRFLLDIDPTHRAIVSVPGSGVSLRTLRPAGGMQTVDLQTASASPRTDLGGFFVEGFRHILYGVDHLAFLLGLLIPTLTIAIAGGLSLGRTMAELLTLVSVFTLAHSITLGLAAFDLIRLAPRLVESIVALSVLVAGAQGVLAGRIRWAASAPLWLVFAFGLIHGIGFGSALGGAGFGGRAAVSALFGFNVGVEAGQLAVLAVIFPLAWTLRGTSGFRRFLLPAAALVIMLAGAAWFLSRAFGIDTGPFTIGR